MEQDEKSGEVEAETKETTTEETEVEEEEDEGEEEKKEPEADETDWKGEALKYKAILDRQKRRENRQSITPDKKPESFSTPEDSEYITKADFYRDNQKTAIRLATTSEENDTDEVKAMKAEIDENWDSIRTFYTAHSGQGTSQDILEDIYDAHAAWKRRNPTKGGDASKHGRADIGPERGQRGSSANSGQTEQPKRSILGKREKPEEWYS